MALVLRRQNCDRRRIADEGSMTPVLAANLLGLMGNARRARLVAGGELDLNVIPHLELVETDLLLLCLVLTLGLARSRRVRAQLTDLGPRRHPDDVNVVPLPGR